MRSASTAGAYVDAGGPVNAAVIPTTYESSASAGADRSAERRAVAAPRIHVDMLCPPVGSVHTLTSALGTQCLSHFLRQQTFLVIVIHGVDELFETLLHERALDLASRGDRLTLLPRVEHLRQNAKVLDLLDARELHVGLVDLGLDQPFDLAILRKNS